VRSRSPALKLPDGTIITALSRNPGLDLAAKLIPAARVGAPNGWVQRQHNVRSFARCSGTRPMELAALDAFPCPRTEGATTDGNGAIETDREPLVVTASIVGQAVREAHI
jgi:hypothetical protein